MACYQRLVLIFFASAIVFLGLLPQQALAVGVCAKRHLLSWESRGIKECHRKFKGHRTGYSLFSLKRRKVIKLEQSTLFNRRSYQFSTPIYEAGTIYVGIDAGKFYAISAKNSLQKLWVANTVAGVHAAAATANQHVYFGDVAGFAYALDKSTGKELWRTELDDEILAAPLIVDDKVYFHSLSGRLFALDRQSGVSLWHTDAIEKSWGFSVRKASTPVHFQGNIYIGTSTGLVVSYRANNGDINWLRQLGDRSQIVFDVDAKVLLHEGRLYTSSADGALFCLKPQDGRIIWQLSVGGVNDVAISDDRLFVTGQGMLSAVDLKNHQIIWQQDFDTPELSAPVFGENYLAVVSTKDKLYMLDPISGDIGAARFIRKGSFGEPLVVDGTLYVLSNSSHLFGFYVKDTKHRSKRAK